MQQKRKKIFAILSLMTLALLGLIGLQWVLLEHARALKEQTFRQNVHGALNGIVQKIERHETIATVIAITVGDSTSGGVEIMNWIDGQPGDSAGVADSLRLQKKLQFITSIMPDCTAKIIATLPESLKMFMRPPDLLAKDTLRFVEKLAVTAKAKKRGPDSPGQPNSFNFRYMVADSTIYSSAQKDAQSDVYTAMAMYGGRKQILIHRVLDQLESSKALSLEARIKPAVLDSIIGMTLLENGIDMPYIYGVKRKEQSEYALAEPQEMADRLDGSEFRTPLFPYDLFGGHDELILHFPEQSRYLMKETGPLLAATIVLMSVIVFGFIYAVLTIFRQRRFADSLTTFINNMTHEFKTPISTISLAAEAMTNPTATKDKKRLDRYIQIIGGENSRLRQQVEKILQMAVLEKGDYELNLAEVDIHETIKTAIENIALQVEKRGGKIISDLRATTGKIKADTVHIANVIYNLLDNANKYTQEKPHITVSTRNDASGVHICVKDNGIGLREEDRKRVFEKYFRVATGNVHDVKGFGLGLSYVRLMVHAHGGTVGVQSQLGQGSTFDVFLPYPVNV